MSFQACTSCGLILQNPQPSERQLAETYGPNYFIGSGNQSDLASQFERVKRATARLQLDELGKYLGDIGLSSNGLRLLEIGPGHGNMLVEAQSRGYEVYGLEISADAAAIANRKLRADAVRVGVASDVGMLGQSYQVCILADVIEHVRDPRNLLTSVWRALEVPGVLYIATPSLDSWSAKVLRRYWMEFKREHLFYFNAYTITRLLTDLGFKQVEITRGKKVLSPDYIIGHFEKFPVPIITTIMHNARRLMPRRILGAEIRVVASGINLRAAKL